jgi:arginyl-tRNA synthetase
MQNYLAQYLFPHLLSLLPQAPSDSVSEAELKETLLRSLQLPKIKSSAIDYTLNCGPLSRFAQQKPQLFAQNLATHLQSHLQGLVVAVHPAQIFINFSLDKSEMARLILEKILKEGSHYGRSDIGKGKTVCIEYSSPNIAKHFAVYHLLSTLIGNTLANFYEAQGWKVLRLNHIGDWGTSIGYLIAGIQQGIGVDAFYHDYQTLSGDDFLQKMQDEYVEFHQKTKAFDTEHPDQTQQNPYRESARITFIRLEQKETQTWDIFQKIRERSLKVFLKFYQRLGITFDSLDGESFFMDRMSADLKRFEERGVVSTSEGAQVIFLNDLPKAYRVEVPCMVRKSDGGTTYHLRDLSAALYRKETYHFDRLLYVVASQQIHHFTQVFGALRKAGFEWIDQVEHLPFGMMSINGMTGSTRKGNVVVARDLLDEAEKRVRDIMISNNEENQRWNTENQSDAKPVLSPEEMDINAPRVALGAIVFQNVCTHRLKDKEFRFEEALNFTGNSGPYLQMAVPKMQRILWKHQQREGTPLPSNPDYRLLQHPSEIALIFQLGELESALNRALEHHEPSIITSYLLDLAGAAHKFHHDCRVLQAETPALRDIRLLLTHVTAQVLSNGLQLLGIPIPEKM